MKKYLLATVVIFTFSLNCLYGQINQDNGDVAKPKQQVEESNKKSEVKAVPAAKGRNVKPKKVNSQKPRVTRPTGVRPARNTRPSVRPVRPGNGRN